MEDIFKIQYGIETIEQDQRQIIEWFVDLEERDLGGVKKWTSKNY